MEQKSFSILFIELLYGKNYFSKLEKTQKPGFFCQEEEEEEEEEEE